MKSMPMQFQRKVLKEIELEWINRILSENEQLKKLNQQLKNLLIKQARGQTSQEENKG